MKRQTIWCRLTTLYTHNDVCATRCNVALEVINVVLSAEFS